MFYVLIGLMFKQIGEAILAVERLSRTSCSHPSKMAVKY